MRVAELTGIRQFRLVEKPIEDPGPGQVQVRVEAVGVCGSDMHSYAEGAVGDTPCAYPMVLGHEPAGVVVRTGPGVSGWCAGDVAAFEPALYCYHCEFCLAGRHNVCANLRFLSMPEDPGFFRDLVNLPARNLLPLPPNLGSTEATLIEPLAVALHSLQFAGLKPGETAAVFGAGPIGLLTLSALKLAGARRVWVVDPLAYRCDMAVRMGADVALDPGAADPAREILRETANRGVDVTIDCAAKGSSMNQSIQITRNGGRVVFTGIPSETQVPLDFHPWRRKELSLFQVRRSNHEGETARNILSAHLHRFAPLITHARPLQQIGPAFAQLERYEDGIGKLVLRLTE